MCGIVGYIGKNNASDYLLDGLETLEYRGYDSAGIAVLEKSGVRAEKITGRVENLRKEIADRPLQGHVGVGHTRWATHGAVTQKNSHPHWDQNNEFYVIHNGIIENYQEIKEYLTKKGVKFYGETDTEVIPNLIADLHKQHGDVEIAFKAAIKSLRGAYAIVMMSSLDPKHIYAAKLSSPLAIGVGKDGMYIGSDAIPMSPHTNKVVFLEDNEGAVISDKSYNIFHLETDASIDRPAELVEIEQEAADKGEFPDFMLKEIHEVSKTIRSTMLGRLIINEDPGATQMNEVADFSSSTAKNRTNSTISDAHRIKSVNLSSEPGSVYDSVIKQDSSVRSAGFVKLGGLELVRDQLDYIDRITVLACGTSYYAGLVGEYLLEEIAGIPVEVQQASEFRYRTEPLSRSTAVLVVSQSGETADTIAALKKLDGSGILKLGIVNAPGSTLARMTDAGVYCHAGPEKAVASTKAFVAQITVFLLMSLHLSKNYSGYDKLVKELDQLPQKIEMILEQEQQIKKLAKKYSKYNDFLYIGRRYAYPVALEGALKLKEISYIHAEGFAGGEMKHGPLALIDPNFPTFATALSNDLHEKSFSNMQEIHTRGGKIIAVVDDKKSEAAKLADDIILVPKVSEQLQPLVAVMPAFLFAYYVAKELNRDIDKPRNLAKSVTVE